MLHVLLPQQLVVLVVLLVGRQRGALPAKSCQQVGLLQLAGLGGGLASLLLLTLLPQIGSAVGQARWAAAMLLLLLLLLLLLQEVLLLHGSRDAVVGALAATCLQSIEQRRLLLRSHGASGPGCWGWRGWLVQQAQVLQLQQLLSAQAGAAKAATALRQPQACRRMAAGATSNQTRCKEALKGWNARSSNAPACTAARTRRRRQQPRHAALCSAHLGPAGQPAGAAWQ
jgi:hypothetical protein